MATSPHFELYMRDDGDWGFRLRAANGELIATSEGYTRKQSAEDGIEAVKDAVMEIVSEGTATEVVE